MNEETYFSCEFCKLILILNLNLFMLQKLISIIINLNISRAFFRDSLSGENSFLEVISCLLNIFLYLLSFLLLNPFFFKRFHKQNKPANPIRNALINSCFLNIIGKLKKEFYQCFQLFCQNEYGFSLVKKTYTKPQSKYTSNKQKGLPPPYYPPYPFPITCAAIYIN